DLGGQRAGALDGDGDARAGDRLGAPGDEQAAGVAHAVDALLVQVEAADLVGGAEAVLDRADHAELGVAVALEVEHDVDQVLQHARSGDRAVLGDVADEDGGHAALLGQPYQVGGDLADLGDAAGHAAGLRR